MDLRSEVGAAVRLALLEAGGNPNAVDRGALVKTFLSKGGSRSSLFRWIAADLERSEEENVTATLPPVPSLPQVSWPRLAAGASGEPQIVPALWTVSPIAVAEKLTAIMEASEKVMRHAEYADGRVRLPKSLLAASEHLRRTLETASKLHCDLVATEKLQRFLGAVLEEMSAESPDIQARILSRIKALDAQWRQNG